MGILVRNVIIMYDYAEELRLTSRPQEELDANPALPAHYTAREAIYLSAQRRMRPIFLTSAAASVGVIPMILSGSGLWTPMGNVIFYGTIITMILILTVMPVAYWLLMRGTDEKRQKSIDLENN